MNESRCEESIELEMIYRQEMSRAECEVRGFCRFRSGFAI
jgi:hypothetical protein